MPGSSGRPSSVVNRYVAGQFLTFFVPILVTFVLLYLLVDLFDRLNMLLSNQASADAAARYFLFKIPLMVTQITPPAVITAVLLAFGMLSRRNEIIALRSGGISLVQTALPILALAAAISVASFIWNETVVPYCTRKSEFVNKIEIRKGVLRGVLSQRAIWYHGAEGFYNMDYVDRDRQAIYNLTIYRLDDEFRLHSVINVPRAQWVNGRWEATGVVEYELGGDTFHSTVIAGETLPIPETPDDFLEVQREAEELSYTELRDRIDNLTRKGIDASHYLVDLYLKLALPFSSTVLALVAIPIGGRLQRHPSIAAIIGLGTAIGFCYWVLLGLSMSLGQSGAISPLLAAWSANVIYALLGAALFLWID
jgi:lipopolysaccharide export system permease protein